MKFPSSQLVDEFSDLIIAVYGTHTQFNHISGFETATEQSVVFIQDSNQAPTHAAIVIAPELVAAELSKTRAELVVGVHNVRLAQALIKQRFDDYQAHDLEWDAIHPSAVIHNTAIMGSGCRIGPNSVIGAEVTLGENTTIRANTVIEHGSHIGQNCIINANVNIGYNTMIGDSVCIQAGAIIASEGYGFAPDSSNHYQRIPHTGHVVIGDDVHIGANSCVDRGTYGATTLERGVKIDNLVHVAHNVTVGEDSLLTAQTVIAGSSTLGKRVICSGQTGILDHKVVPDDTVLVQRAGVSQDLPHGGMWAGSPAKPFKQWVREQGTSKKIARLERQLKELQTQLKDLK